MSSKRKGGPGYHVAMDFKKLAPVLLAFGLSASAKAQVVGIVPVKLPTTIVNIIPVQMPSKLILPLSLPTVDAVIITPIRSPYTPAYIPVSEPVNLPAAPALIVGKAVLPGAPSLPEVEAYLAKPAKAVIPSLDALRDPVAGREKITTPGAEYFDGAREHSRASALPGEKFF